MIIKPDGTMIVSKLGALATGVYIVTGEAGHPTGTRTMIREAWVGDQRATDTVAFTILEGD